MGIGALFLPKKLLCTTPSPPALGHFQHEGRRRSSVNLAPLTFLQPEAFPLAGLVPFCILLPPRSKYIQLCDSHVLRSHCHSKLSTHTDTRGTVGTATNMLFPAASLSAAIFAGLTVAQFQGLPTCAVSLALFTSHPISSPCSAAAHPPWLISKPSIARLCLAVLLRRLLRRLRHRPQVHLRKPGLPRKRCLLPGRRLQRGRPAVSHHLCPADLQRQRRRRPRPGQLLDCLGRKCHGHRHSERLLQQRLRHCHRGFG